MTTRPLSGYKVMWMFAMFDLPVVAAADRKEATRFRKLLLNDSYSMLQYSVYARFCASEDAASVHRSIIKGSLPPHGQVRILTVTDRQFEKMEVYQGAKREKTEEPVYQLTLF